MLDVNIPLESLWYPFGLTVFAGLATGLGAAIAFFTRSTHRGILSLTMGFAAGVMLYVSFVEILAKARESLTEALGASGPWYTVLAFFVGMAVIALIDYMVPDYENPHQVHSVEEMELGEGALPKNNAHDFAKLRRTGIFAAVAIAIHNFPEGLATFTAAIMDPSLGMAIAVAIALHNVPEGIAISIPIYYATGSRKKAFGYAFLSGLAEPLGAIVGYALLLPFFTAATFGTLFAGVAGIMVYISLDQLLPAAQEFGEHHLSILGVVAGMLVMAISLLLL
ncbi:MAG: zinc transporter ZupT [Pseudomonadota bacterium]